MQILDTAKYLGSNVYSCSANGIWVSITHYMDACLPGHSWHAHVNPHATLLLAGGTLEKRRNADFERNAGDIVFFHGEEPHKNSNTLIPSRNLNIEFEPLFFLYAGIREAELHTAFQRNPAAACVML